MLYVYTANIRKIWNHLRPPAKKWSNKYNSYVYRCSVAIDMIYKNEFPDLINNCDALPIEKNDVQSGMAGIIQICKKKYKE